MKLHFDPNHQYQLDAVKSIIDLFEGQPLNQGDFGFSISENGQLFFEESFRDISSRAAYKGLIPFSVGEIHNGYFSQDKKGKFKDTQKTAKAKADIDTFKLIMRDKERLLSTEEPLRFIFSHSALREGWDNPQCFSDLHIE